MARRIEPRDPGNRGPSRGLSYLYVLPCAYEDILKLGFSRDPLGRMQALHPRWFEFFDLDRAFLVEAETVRDARDLELGLGRVIAEHNAPAPLVIRREAAGHTEWYRGAYDALATTAHALAAGGYAMHAPLRPWLRERLVERSDRLFSWTMAMLPPEVLEMRDPSSVRRVLDMLDAFGSLNIELEPWLPPQVLDWYRSMPPA
ncbi:MAG TPA: GIY-YIG nuclease family protein [Luteimonas sp.]|nr:GIY-YIG nuclease family protein [Luteimonas sp.]